MDDLKYIRKVKINNVWYTGEITKASQTLLDKLNTKFGVRLGSNTHESIASMELSANSMQPERAVIVCISGKRSAVDMHRMADSVNPGKYNRDPLGKKFKKSVHGLFFPKLPNQ